MNLNAQIKEQKIKVDREKTRLMRTGAKTLSDDYKQLKAELDALVEAQRSMSSGNLGLFSNNSSCSSLVSQIGSPVNGVRHHPV